MESIGAEVGQKMRSAIKAKLLELNCYVDDELPDYVMVMVANKRTKSQMKEDLQLFLAAKTAAFVDWLHIVLKKLKEVTVTNPEVLKKATKRKSDEVPNIALKKEKKEKKDKAKNADRKLSSVEDTMKSLTDDLPINARTLSEQRKIIIMKENQSHNGVDDFDIPLLSEVNMSTEEELEDIERQIKTVKSRLGLMVESEDDDFINLKTEPEELFGTKSKKKSRKPQPDEPPSEKPQESPKRQERAKITFNPKTDSIKQRKSVLERLGKRKARAAQPPKRTRSEGTRHKPKEGIMSRLGVMSKVSVPNRAPQEPEQPPKVREVSSVVKIRPRVIPADAPQANKNLLLKAVAEAQRSVAQSAKKVGSTLKPDALFTKKYKSNEQTIKKKIPKAAKEKLRKFLESEREAVSEDEEKGAAVNGDVTQQFIITLDGIEKTQFKGLAEEKVPIKSRLDNRKKSPIIYGAAEKKSIGRVNIPDKLPVVQASLLVKNKEKCKYWPNCRQGDKCEFLHASNCEKFPLCKFGDKCLFLHPTCKFGSSCTRRGCVYTHSLANKNTVSKPVPVLQTCKFFPNCNKINCTFLHPKQCKFGKYCKNPEECTFSHGFVPKGSLTWRSTI